jgi:large subunit ribosomal protein L14
MNTVKTNFGRGLPVGTVCKCADNSGAKTYKIIGVYKLNACKRRVRSATISDTVSMVVKEGPRIIKKKVLRGVVVRQVRPIFRKNEGYRLSFNENAIVAIDKENNVVNTRIKGVVAREALIKIPSIGGKGAIIV